MGTKGRVMFDLNELPEDDADTPLLEACEPSCMHPPTATEPQVMHLPNKDDVQVGVVLPVTGSLSSSVEPLAPVLGQHPLSCFRPFVKAVPKGSNASDLIRNEDKLPMSALNDQKIMAIETSYQVSSKQHQNGFMTDDSRSKMSNERENIDMEDARLNIEGNGLRTDSCPNDETTDREAVSQISPSDDSEVQKGAYVNVGNTPTAEPEDNRTANISGTDSFLKSDSFKGHPSTESKFLANFGKRGRSDLKDAMLGKKRSRQTMFLDVREAAKQAPPPKIPSTKRSSTLSSRSQKDTPKTPVGQATVIESRTKDPRNLTGSSMIANPEMKSNVPANSDSVLNDTLQVSKKIQCTDGSSEVQMPVLGRQNSGKEDGSDRSKISQLVKSAGAKHVQGKLTVDDKASSYARSPAKKPPYFKKPVTYSQDSSIERLHREATCDKLWKSTGETELQCVPGSFDSVQEYVSVFEPLLFEECRAQLHSTWEELCEGVTKDPHIPVYVKSIERRERGWYDVVLMPVDNPAKLGFKEGDVAVISTPRPGSGIRVRRANGSNGSEADFSTRTAGIIRRYMPIDTRDLHGATLRIYLGEIQMNEEPIMKKYQTKGTIWYLTVLGSLATTQREYVALHAFQNLQSQMIKAILNPKPEFFPRYEDEPPAMPDCFTQPFLQHLNKNFNTPQLTAIKWAAMHTASGSHHTSAGKRQDTWPFTLVQGPPGTGKTHTVWGMLNVIHLVQYQRYYAALLKKLAPDSLKTEESNETSTSHGNSLDDVLEKMDRNLSRILPKLCPKPRMLVCAPSNAATDELLTRVLERGFIDGEMKVYRPDVARVGVDTQTRASQAVSVERRSDNLLGMSKDDVFGWLQQLRGREVFLSQQIATLQQDLAAAAAARAQGSVGIDPDVLSARDHTRDSKLQVLAAVVEERDKVLVEMSRLFIVESRLRSGFSLEDARAKLEASFANEAEIVFTTVSSSGRRLFNNLTHGFDMVVIDEAAQASEAAILPPLSLGAARCVLIGDPQQLPATVISRAAHTLQYSRSLFERFQQGGCPTMLLSVQYRMHPQIRDFPSRYFYQGRLIDSESVASLPDEPYHQDALLRPYVFYDVSHGRESHKGNSVSFQNITEAQFAAQLYEYLQNFIKAAGIAKVSVGVITPYKLQLRCLQQEFGSIAGSDSDKVYINTVDAFQGQERDIIIMSCVRASSHGVGFVADIRRMNVALTRARRCLWVIGNAAALVQSEDWAALIADAKERGCFVSMNSSHVRSLLGSSNSAPASKAPGLLRFPRSANLSNKTDEIKMPVDNQGNIKIDAAKIEMKPNIETVIQPSDENKGQAPTNGVDSDCKKLTH